MKKLLIPGSLLLVLVLALAMALLVGAVSGAPVAENLELETYRGVSIGGNLSAKTADGSAVTFEITTEPVKGRVDLDPDGHFVYTPIEGKRGRDYFGYKAVDENGVRSQEATVIIKIQKQKSKVTYSDTSGLGCAYAAAKLAEEDIFVGECFAGSYVFAPEQPVSRGEFLALCLRCTGTETLSGVRSTGFGDDGDIDDWEKPYVSTALLHGIVSGYTAETGAACFRPDEPVTAAEAAAMLDRAADLTDAVAAWFSFDDAVPAWALQSAANVSACGLLPGGCSFRDETLSRGDAAVMLVRTMELLAKR